MIDALRLLQQEREQLALVVNEYGAVEGVITVEDLIEELVGEIYDETDRDVLSVLRRPDGELVLPGRFPIHDLEDLGVDLPAGDYATVAGLLLTNLGHLPRVGEGVPIGEWFVEALELKSRAISRVGLRPLPRSARSQSR